MSLRGLFRGLKEEDVDPDPMVQFDHWFGTARRSGIYLPEAFTLATATPDGKPSARMMLLKGTDADGFVFFTNFESRKGGELESNARAAMVFHWNILMRQVRVEGAIEKAGDEASYAYFKTRGTGSRIGAWASPQSRTIPNRGALEERVREATRRFAGQDIPLPPFWGGFRLKPERVEFWQGRPDRLHDRICYARTRGGWERTRLAP
jgi:pyridoxamine 5'-phosphate oxidase